MSHRQRRQIILMLWIGLVVFFLVMAAHDFYLIASAQEPIAGYTTDAQQDETTLGLALPDGRYEITPGDDCAGIETWMDVSVYVEFGMPWVITPRGSDWPQCHTTTHVWRDPTPCFKDADVCAVSQEFD